MVINTDKKFYSIRDSAELLGVSKQTLMRYERRGFFPRARRNPINGWREYTLNDIQKLKKILGRE